LSSSDERPSWDETWLSVARVIARRSLCVRDQVGAVIVDPRNRIVATGYNGPPAGFNADGSCTQWCLRARRTVNPLFHMNQFEQLTGVPTESPLAPDYSDCPSLHAEANALSVCDRSVREDGTIYVTSAICFGCAKLIANSGLTRVFARSNQEHAYRNSSRSYEFLESCGIRVDVTR